MFILLLKVDKNYFIIKSSAKKAKIYLYLLMLGYFIIV